MGRSIANTSARVGRSISSFNSATVGASNSERTACFVILHRVSMLLRGVLSSISFCFTEQFDHRRVAMIEKEALPARMLLSHSDKSSIWKTPKPRIGISTPLFNPIFCISLVYRESCSRILSFWFDFDVCWRTHDKMILADYWTILQKWRQQRPALQTKRLIWRG